MDLLTSFLFIGVFVVFFLPSMFFCAELLLGLFKQKTNLLAGSLKPFKILIPAHNEAQIIEDTLVKLRQEIGTLEDVLVIADNCSDDTADLVKKLGASVLERQHETLKGKGYALDAGVQALNGSEIETIVVFDADCEFAEGSFKQLVLSSQARDEVVQSLYLMKSPDGAEVKTRIAEFAWLVKNLVRPLGLSKAGINCQLQGSGMAFPWRIFDQVSFASGSIVEDLELGLKLNDLGEKVGFTTSSTVLSYFPISEQGSETQRTRWEHGHMASISILPNAMWQALKAGRVKGFFTALDAMIPPTVLWIMMVTLITILTGITHLFLPNSAFFLALISFLALTACLGFSWLRYGRRIIGLSDIFSILVYALGKFNIYKKFLGNRQKDWVRTDRGE